MKITFAILLVPFTITRSTFSTPWMGKLQGEGDYVDRYTGIVSLRTVGGFRYCVGILISRFSVLSAAYCIRPYQKRTYFGNVHVYCGKRRYLIQFMETHSKYNQSGQGEFDIGLITMRTKTNSNRIISLYSKNVSNGPFDRLQVKGYCRLLHKLCFLDVVNVVYDLCTEQHQSENQSFYIMPENENETIQKDDIGSPVFKRGTVVGILSGHFITNLENVVACTSVTDPIIQDYIKEALKRSSLEVERVGMK